MTHDDMGLVREFAASQSERAFAIPVERHIGLVHSMLHRYFDQHGIPSTTAILAGAISANCSRRNVNLNPRKRSIENYGMDQS
jgi:hypothetical protein